MYLSLCIRKPIIQSTKTFRILLETPCNPKKLSYLNVLNKCYNKPTIFKLNS